MNAVIQTFKTLLGLFFDDGSLALRQVLALAEQLRFDSQGHFDVRGHRADGGLDPSGVVKGWAVEEAAWILDAARQANLQVSSNLLNVADVVKGKLK